MIWLRTAAAIVSLAVMGWVDYLTGYELVFSCAYLVPVSICAWYFGMGSVLAMSVAGAVVSLFTDKLSGHVHSQEMFHYLNSFTCFLISAISGSLLHRLRHTLEERKSANDQLRKALEDLERSTEEIRDLQNGLQIICAWTQRIKVGDKWMTASEFLTKQLHLKLSHGLSPEAGAQMRAEIEAARPPELPQNVGAPFRG